MWQPSRAQWAIILPITILLVLAWPPSEGKSLGAKALNWIVDPGNTLPEAPTVLPMSLDDDGDAVAAHDAAEQEYNRVYQSSASTKRRMDLKIAGDPFEPTTERQLLIAIGVLAALAVWRLDGRREKKNREGNM